ncbi:MAG: hypothetical protein WD020_01055, partial [Acidimicrobiia bacterium]
MRTPIRERPAQLETERPSVHLRDERAETPQMVLGVGVPEEEEEHDPLLIARGETVVLDHLVALQLTTVVVHPGS